MSKLSHIDKSISPIRITNSVVSMLSGLLKKGWNVLMDIQMPVMDGFETTRVLLDSGFKIHIVALTARAMAEEIAHTGAVGCNAHLTKPLNQEVLVRTIKEHIARRE